MHQLDILNQILDAEEKAEQQRAPARADSYHVRAYILLAALFLIRLSILPEHFTSKAHFSAHTTLLHRLRYHLECSSDVFETVKDRNNRFSEARIWALFAGAQSEHQAALLNKGQTSASAFGDWFNVRLAERVKRHGVLTWEGVKEVLQGFMLFEMVPDPAKWFPELIGLDKNSGHH